MVAQAVGDDIGLTDIAAGVADCSFVVTEQQVDAGALNLVALQQAGQVGTASGEHVASPVGDLRRRQPTRRAVDEEELDLLAAHAPIISSASDKSVVAWST